MQRKVNEGRLCGDARDGELKEVENELLGCIRKGLAVLGRADAVLVRDEGGMDYKKNLEGTDVKMRLRAHLDKNYFGGDGQGPQLGNCPNVVARFRSDLDFFLAEVYRRVYGLCDELEDSRREALNDHSTLDKAMTDLRKVRSRNEDLESRVLILERENCRLDQKNQRLYSEFEVYSSSRGNGNYQGQGYSFTNDYLQNPNEPYSSGHNRKKSHELPAGIDNKSLVNENCAFSDGNYNGAQRTYDIGYQQGYNGRTGFDDEFWIERLGILEEANQKLADEKEILLKSRSKCLLLLSGKDEIIKLVRFLGLDCLNLNLR